MRLERLVQWAICFLVTTSLFASCATETPTSAVIDDQYPATVVDGGEPSVSLPVYKAWWGSTLFVEPVAPGSQSDAQRTVPVSDFAYVLLAPGWNSTSATPPTRLFAARSFVQLSADRGDTLDIAVSDATFGGNCLGGKPISQADADFVTSRIFPGDFAGFTYDAATCTMVHVADGGSGGSAGGDGAGGDGGMSGAGDALGVGGAGG